MKLWILKNCTDLPSDNDPWDPWYDKNFGFVIRAESVAAARRMAAECAGDEPTSAWLKPEYSTCCELKSEGKPEVVIADFAAG